MGFPGQRPQPLEVPNGEVRQEDLPVNSRLVFSEGRTMPRSRDDDVSQRDIEAHRSDIRLPGTATALRPGQQGQGAERLFWSQVVAICSSCRRSPSIGPSNRARWRGAELFAPDHHLRLPVEPQEQSSRNTRQTMGGRKGYNKASPRRSSMITRSYGNVANPFTDRRGKVASLAIRRGTRRDGARGYR